ncbi:alpha/beta hydrolase [Taklimakanibacter lacteus]|uniref:alpha/beta hydrolase n=1 Tax=Taklimakanibacter lacteus TaxID=2268456 RepID=UPI000E6737BB
MSLDLFWLLRAVCVLALASYLLAAGYMYVTQRDHQYFPDHQGLSASAVGLAGVADLKLATSDGETLQAWYAKAPPERPTILFLHGNGGEIAGRGERFAAYQAGGFGVFFLSYRGYGASSGNISEAGLVRDALAAYDWLTAQGIKPAEIMLVGESLGGGVAVQLAAEKPVAALALEATFASAASVAGQRYWWLPVRLLMKDKFDSLDYIGKVHAPLLITHGDQDGAIPLSEGEKLFALANEPKQLTVVPGGTHSTIFSPETWTSEMMFFDRHAGQ